jgi:hypothetical protein
VVGAGVVTGSPLTADPLLGSLQDNGGATATMAPDVASPVIDAGVASGLSTDQRGAARPLDFPGVTNAPGGDGSDIGAFELQPSCAGQPSPAVACHGLTVSLGGTGTGTVSGGGIACPGSCSSSYPSGTSVTLTAQAAAGSTFAGWSGACTGTGTCELQMDTDRAVTATFTATPPAPPPKPSCTLKPGSARVFVKAPARAAKAKPRKGVLKLTAACSQSASVSLTGKVTARRNKRPKLRTFRVKALRSSVKAGKPITLTVKLPAAAVAALKSGARESAAFSLTAKNAGGTTQTPARFARLKPRKSK